MVKKNILAMMLCTLCLVLANCGGSGSSTDNNNNTTDACGTEANPCIISTADELNAVGGDSHNTNTTDYSALMAKHYKLANDIDMTGTTFNTIGLSVVPFSGTFDGNNKKISNLTINSSDTYGVSFMGGLSGIVKDLGLENVNISGVEDVGGLVGNNFGSISNCYVTGIITGTASVGGLVGYNSDDSGTISNSYSTASVTGTGNFVGGLVGHNNGNIIHSHATGSVIGTEQVGGLVGSHGGVITSSFASGAVNGTNSVGGLIGFNSDSGTTTNSYSTSPVSATDYAGGLAGLVAGTITNSYSRGSVSGTTHLGGLIGGNSSGTIISSYWDTVTSGRATSAGGTGKTTVQMKQAATFSGWDFSDTWDITETVTYPSLQ